jgi:hypothetical protein
VVRFNVRSIRRIGIGRDCAIIAQIFFWSCHAS